MQSNYNSYSTSTDESDYLPDEFVFSFSEEGELEFQGVKKELDQSISVEENTNQTTKKRKVLKKRGRKRNSLRRSFTLLEGEDIYFNGYNPDYIICEPLDTFDSNLCICSGIDRISNEKVAIKIVDMNDEINFIKTKKELSILKLIGGRNGVINVKASFSDNQMLHVVQYFPTENLEQRVLKRGIQEYSIKILMKQLVDCLYFMHKSGIIHGNLSPRNINFKYSDNDEIFVSDFTESVALSNIVGNSYQFKNSGSLYSSPEQISSSTIPKDHLGKVDTWSLGIVLYFCLTRSLPFANHEELINKDIDSLFVKQNDFFSLVQSCLIKDPVKRPFVSDINKVYWINSE